ncbi:ATP-binding cassette subfamily G member 4-like isoform X2 [Amblyomma americanum]
MRVQHVEDFAKDCERKFINVDISDKDGEHLQMERCTGVTLEWKNITYHVKATKGKKLLLSSLYGLASPGTLTAVMGPSGAGKTTLLNILSGHIDKTYEGEVQVNGYVRDTNLFNMQSCYVMQDDCLLQYLTVREALSTSIRLRTSTRRKNKILELVEDIIKLWGLEHCADTLTRSLSGGEKKRLVIAQELVNNSPVVLVDEPTSGLDSSSALCCVRVLKSLAESGRTVLCSVHSPSARLFSHFDRLYMLSEGKCIYNGSAEMLVSFLDSQKLHCPPYHSPSDFITSIASGEHGELTEKLSSLFIPKKPSMKDSKNGDDLRQLTIYGGQVMTEKEKAEERRQHKVHAKSHQLFLTLLERFFYCSMRNKITSVVRMLVNLFFAFLLSLVYYDSGKRATQINDTIAMYLMAQVILIFQAIGPAVFTLPYEVKVLLREQRNCCYSPSLYYTARILSEVPFTVAGPLVIMTTVHWTTSQPMEFYRLAIIVAFSVAFCSACEGLAYVASATFSMETAIFMACPVAAPSLMFCGFFAQPRYMMPAVRWITYTSHMYYVHRAIMLAVYGGGRGEIGCDEQDVDVACVPVDGDHVLDRLGIHEVDLFAYFGIVLAIDFALKLTAFALLKWRLWRRV